MSRALSVWWDAALVGTLRVDQYGEMTFVYASSWLADSSRLALSISLPKRPEPFKRRECRPFFAGLLPEDMQRRIIEETLHISKRNDFQLLETRGAPRRDTIGMSSDRAPYIRATQRAPRAR